MGVSFSELASLGAQWCHSPFFYLHHDDFFPETCTLGWPSSTCLLASSPCSCTLKVMLEVAAVNPIFAAPVDSLQHWPVGGMRGSLHPMDGADRVSSLVPSFSDELTITSPTGSDSSWVTTGWLQLAGVQSVRSCSISSSETPALLNFPASVWIEAVRPLPPPSFIV